MTTLSKRLWLGGTAIAATMTMAAPAHAAAFYLQEQSTRAIGRAFSGEAADLGAASLWWNPASIGGMTGGDGMLGVAHIMPRAKIVDQGTLIVRPGQAPAPVGGDPTASNPIENGTLPSGAIAYGFGQFAVGLAVTSPFSFTTNYDATSFVRYTADKTKLRTIDVQPSIAFAASPNFSLGLALNAEHSKATLSNYLPNLLATLPDGYQQLSGKGWDYGWSAGGQFRSGPLTVGLSYKSSIKHTLKGSVTTTGLLGPLAPINGTIDTKATFRTPWQAIVGVRFAATPQLTLNAQAVRFGWNKFDAIRLGSPLNVAIPENYRNTWSFAGGADFALTPQVTLRAGIQRDQTPTRNGFRDARVPDANRWDFAAGASFSPAKSFTIDAAALYIDFANASIDRVTAAFPGTPVQTPIIPNAELRNGHALALSIGGRVTF